MRILAGAALRAFVVGLLPTLVFVMLASRPGAGVGANIGGGMIVNALTFAGALLWGVSDGRRTALRLAMTTWVLAAVLTCGAHIVRLIVQDGVPPDGHAWAVAAIVAAVPAVAVLVAGVFGSTLGSGGHISAPGHDTV